MPIIAADFYRMTAAIHTALASIGITRVEQLAAMTAAEIDALPVKGIGKVLSAKWQETALRLVDQRKISERSAQSAPVVVGAPILETITPVEAKAPPVVTEGITKMAVPALVTCDSLCSVLASKLTMEVVGSTLQLKCDGVVIASATLPSATTADLALTKTGPATGKYNDVLTFTLDVSNIGQANADGTKVCDTLPAGLTFQSATPAPTTTSPLCWDLGTLAPGAAQTITYQARVTDADITLTNAAEATTTSVEGDYANNAATVSVVIPPHCTSSGTVLGSVAGPYSAGPCSAQATLVALQACLQAAGFTVTLTPTGTASPTGTVQSAWNNIAVPANATSATYTNTQGTISVTETTDAGTVFTGVDARVGNFQHLTTQTPGLTMGVNYTISNISSTEQQSPIFVIDGNSGVSAINLTQLRVDYDQTQWEAVVRTANMAAATPIGTVLNSGTTYPVTNSAFTIEFRPKPGTVLSPGEATTIQWTQTNPSAINNETNGLSVAYIATAPDYAISITGTSAVPTVTGGNGSATLTTNCV